MKTFQKLILFISVLILVALVAIFAVVMDSAQRASTEPLPIPASVLETVTAQYFANLNATHTAEKGNY